MSWGWTAQQAESHSLFQSLTESNEENAEQQGLCSKKITQGGYVASTSKIIKQISKKEPQPVIPLQRFLHLTQSIYYWPPRMAVKQMDPLTV